MEATTSGSVLIWVTVIGTLGTIIVAFITARYARENRRSRVDVAAETAASAAKAEFDERLDAIDQAHRREVDGLTAENARLIRRVEYLERMRDGR